LSLAFESGQIHNGWLLGDSAHGLKPWLLKPVLSPSTAKERKYNTAHKSTRSVIERTYGKFLYVIEIIRNLLSFSCGHREFYVVFNIICNTFRDNVDTTRNGHLADSMGADYVHVTSTGIIS
jgi:hypothetical protein